ncbi:MAG TPA: hypothetical protein VLX28_04095, partial [Thermoanaerobaculia bacterium]|nr:hypothetical protein [Thermoanaerobaculia bacterium]
LTLAAAASGLYSPKTATADTCVTFCSPANACGYICCYQQCCGNRCIDLDCAPPPPCPGDN